MMRSLLLSVGAALAAAETTLTITTGTQSGFFKTGNDVGELNAHDYRPGEFVTNDFIYEGLTEWDGEHTEGVDGIAGTDDDFVKPSLAASWTTNYDDLVAGTATRYEITFTLRSGVTFHDGAAWDAAACKTNFDHIMGGDGVGPPPGYGSKGKSGWALTGLHDWMGFTQHVYGWEAVGAMQFNLTLDTYYEAVFRELAFIRPFRMMSPLVLPSRADMELSHNRWRCERHRGDDYDFAGRYPGWDGGKCFPRPFPVGCDASKGECYHMAGVKAPVGTGPYKVISKTLSNGDVIPAADFNASCYHPVVTSPPPYLEECRYADGATVSSVRFTKFAGHRKAPTYDNIVMKSYPNVNAIKDALQDGTLDVSYGVQTLSPSAFVSLGTNEEGADVVAHKADHDINTRLIVLNSAGVLNTPDLRKLVMGILAEGRQALYDGELAEEEPMDTLFDPNAPHCEALKTVHSIADLAATKSASVTADALAGKTLRFLYKPDIPHESIIAAYVITQLAVAGIAVEPMPVDKDGYNVANCGYMAPVYSYNDEGADDLMSTTQDNVNCYDAATIAAQGFASAQECFSSYHKWDIAYSETWGPPYDPTAKLWDMTHGHFSGWCSQESDAPAVTNMASMTINEFGTKVRQLSTIVDPAARTALYSEVLTTLHNEAIFLPLTAKRNTAVTSKRVGGFKFGYMEYDLPLTELGCLDGTCPAPAEPAAEAASAVETTAAPTTAAAEEEETPTEDEAASTTESLSDAAVSGIIVGVVLGVVLLIVSVFLCMLISREKAGKPMFTTLESTKPAV